MYTDSAQHANGLNGYMDYMSPVKFIYGDVETIIIMMTTLTPVLYFKENGLHRTPFMYDMRWTGL